MDAGSASASEGNRGGTPSPDTTQEVLEAACEYLSEVLSTFDMAHRVLHDPAAEPPVAG